MFSHCNHGYYLAMSGFVILVGMIPANAKHTQPYLQLVADQFDGMMDGVSVYDAYERRQLMTNNRLLTAINDLRAMSHVSMASQAPALNWACRDCNVLGVKIQELDAVVYVGAIRLLPGCGSTRARTLQREWRARFSGAPKLLALEHRPIFKRDAKFNYDAGVVADEARRISKAEHERAVKAGGFHGLGKYHVICICDDYVSI